MFRALCLVSTLAIVAASGSPALAQDEEKVVNVYNWSDYIDESILEDFTKETGIKVVYDVYDSNEILETKLLSGGTGYDVVLPSASPFLAREIQAGAMQKLDKSKLPNLSHVWDTIAERVSKYDPDNEYSVNYMWGTTGIGYNVDMINERMPDAPVKSWDMVFDPDVISKFQDCGVYMLDAPTEMIPAALNYLGLDPNSTNPDDIDKAEELLKSVRPYIQKFHSSAYIDSLANGDICMAVGWSGDVFQAIDAEAEGINVKYVIPKEGAQMWFDQMSIPADAPHPANAHAFINYILRPDVIAKASNYVFYANGNKDSQQYLDEEIIGDPAIYPPKDVMDKLYTVDPYDPKAQRLITRAWTSVKTGQ
ncbi:polyamine ABC transporter substrate-binding protein [Afifella sp. H1R]|uniref:polyamine ABC transporter substrate-binding protein n=1 Tax=unclassified Afifella TaxID=2624128 RepID=UPI001F1CE666|nr:polyamine ABC transporter substrate-binding protein [Afifella sp. H1R]MCF1504639.1 polyamine ABC transporter substrate-binding protein [Afifella sp. H1R]